MNKIGASSLGMAGVLLTVFVGVVIALALFTGGIAPQVYSATNTYSLTNDTVTLASHPTVNVTDITGQEYIATPAAVITNASNHSQAVIASTNITIGEGVSTTSGLKSVQLTVLDTVWSGQNVNVSYTFGADGYIDNAGGRSLAGLIVLFAALAIGIVALVPTLRNGVLDLVSR